MVDKQIPDTVFEHGVNRMKKTRHGYMLYNPNDIYIGRSLDLYGEFSAGETASFATILQAGSIVLDIGSHIGAHTLFFSQAIGPTGVVMAFEPQRIIYQILCANLALNGLTNVFGYNTALGSSTGSVTVPLLDYSREDNFAGLSLDPGFAGPGEQTTVITIDSLNLPACHLMKIDVEGMEAEVIRGGVESIRRLKPVLYVENDRKANSPALISLLGSLGYRMFWHLPPLFNPDNYFNNGTNIFPDTVSVNMLCVHPDHGVDIQGLREISGPDDWWT
ncbi:MAG: FkbM family methyltransferase [Gammaproteobacteria bacterium]|nr:FkbM family methyltransferase [Gammaproteobacteria bacterium]